MPTPKQGLNAKDKVKAGLWLIRFILQNVIKNPDKDKKEIEKIEKNIKEEMKKMSITDKEIEELIKQTFPYPDFKIS